MICLAQEKNCRTFASKKTVEMMAFMGMSLWAWIVFYVLVFIMLYADLKMFGRKGQHEVNVKEALQMTAVWIVVSHVEIPTTVSLAVIFGVLLLSVLLSVASTKSEARKKNA